jgi:hypothetical protein
VLVWTEADLAQALDAGNVEWRKHVMARMMERGITRREVLDAMRHGERIETYGKDQPFASALLHAPGPPPLHVVAALDQGSQTCFVITAYRPDEAHFEPDLKTSKPK